MDMVILTLRINKILPEPLIALELFGGYGLWTLVDYEPLCHYLELWEINKKYANFAKKFFPKANVNNGDSIKAIRDKTLNKKEYNFVVIDNPIWGGNYGEGYCENFDLFPSAIQILGISE